MAKHDSQAAQEPFQHPHMQEQEKPLEQPVKTASHTPAYDDNDPVTVIWKSWGTSGIPKDKVSYFDRHQFVGGVGRRIPYRDAKKWQQQGHGIHILPANAEEIDFIRATGHAPFEDNALEAMLRSVTPEKLAAMLGPENLDKIAAAMKKG